MSSFLARSERHAKLIYGGFYKDAPLHQLELTVTVPKINNYTITEAHCAKFGDIIQKIGRSRSSNDFDDDTHPVLTPELVRAEYIPVNNSYLCYDPDGHKVYLSPYDWVIIKKKE